jgi:tetratricopeptide (TPR) repeat protein
MVSKCPKCGSEIGYEDAKICHQCGKKLVPIPSPMIQRSEKERAIEKAMAYLRVGFDWIAVKEYDKAIDSFDHAIELSSQTDLQSDILTRVLQGKGHCMFELGRYDEAEKLYRSLIEIQPDNYNGYIGLAKSLIERKNPVEAIKYCDKALEMNPQNARPWVLKAICLNLVGSRENAIRCFLKAKELGYDEKTTLQTELFD